VREHATPSADSQPRAIASHPDGGVWFVETGANALGRIDGRGTIREFRVPTPNSSLRGVTVGPDKNLLWYTANAANQIGCMTQDGKVLGKFPIPTAGSGARCITAFSNGRLYFTQYDASSIGEVIIEG
jgi:virginiamycin B lyase